MSIVNRNETEDFIESYYESKNVKSALYNKKTNDLIITFNNNTRYLYKNVSKEDFLFFDMSESQGKILHYLIKQKYSAFKLDNANF